jgi:hypothetical protein
MPGKAQCTRAAVIQRSCRAGEPRLEKLVRRPVLFLLVLALGAAAAGCGGAGRPAPATPAKPPVHHRRRHRHVRRSGPFSHALSRPHLAPGSDPSALPGDVLIADRSNDRLLVVDPHGRIVWRFPQPGSASLPLPDDAFFSEDGRQIVATEEDAFVISVVDVARRRIVYRYGSVGVAGSGNDRLWNPDDALLLSGRRLLSADIKNCRVIVVRLPHHHVAHAFGSPYRGCYHDPPRAFGSPNGAFPLRNGHILVTEINGDWVDEMTLSGHVVRSWHPPGVVYPSDTNEVRPGLYLTAGYDSPGVLETFDRQGRVHWRYRPRSAAGMLDHPSLALPLPNGDVLATDDYHDRVIVIDPHTNRIVWQYGHTGVAGSAPGYLSRPDGADLVPPHALLARIRGTIGKP